MINKPECWIVHHSATARDTTTAAAIERGHIKRGWGTAGYHFIITADGVTTKFRDLSRPGAHCYQQNMNYRSIGVCLVGYFDKGHDDFPTDAQVSALKNLIHQYKLPVKFHRDFDPKSCPGYNIKRSFIKAITMPKKINEISAGEVRELAHDTHVQSDMGKGDAEWWSDNKTAGDIVTEFLRHPNRSAYFRKQMEIGQKKEIMKIELNKYREARRKLSDLFNTFGDILTNLN